MTGSYQVPVLVFDDGTLVEDSANIVAWAEANPAQPELKGYSRPESGIGAVSVC